MQHEYDGMRLSTVQIVECALGHGKNAMYFYWSEKAREIIQSCPAKRIGKIIRDILRSTNGSANVIRVLSPYLPQGTVQQRMEGTDHVLLVHRTLDVGQFMAVDIKDLGMAFSLYAYDATKAMPGGSETASQLQLRISITSGVDKWYQSLPTGDAGYAVGRLLDLVEGSEIKSSILSFYSLGKNKIDRRSEIAKYDPENRDDIWILFYEIIIIQKIIMVLLTLFCRNVYNHNEVINVLNEIKTDSVSGGLFDLSVDELEIYKLFLHNSNIVSVARVGTVDEVLSDINNRFSSKHQCIAGTVFEMLPLKMWPWTNKQIQSMVRKAVTPSMLQGAKEVRKRMRTVDSWNWNGR